MHKGEVLIDDTQQLYSVIFSHECTAYEIGAQVEVEEVDMTRTG